MFQQIVLTTGDLIAVQGKDTALLARLPLFAAIFPIFDELRVRKCLIDMAWEWAKPSKHAVVPTFPLA